MMCLNFLRTPILTFTALLLALGTILADGACVHPGPYFPIENQFDQPVTIYFNGVKVGKIQPNTTRTFYPNEVLTTTNSELLLEAKSNSGVLLYSRKFTWSQLTEIIEGLHGRMGYKIGSGDE
jgi:hypothetical protein